MIVQETEGFCSCTQNSQTVLHSFCRIGLRNSRNRESVRSLVDRDDHDHRLRAWRKIELIATFDPSSHL